MGLLEQPSARARAAFHPLTVLTVDRLTDDAVAVTFDVPGVVRDTFAFDAGQHLTLRAELDGSEVRQSYSICISPSQARRLGILRIGSRVVPGGRMSTWLNTKVRPGDVVDVMTPIGSFVGRLQQGVARHHVAIAAGSGITPVLSIVASVLEAEPTSRVTLIFGNRSVASIMFLDEVSDLKDRWPDRLQVVHVLSRERQESELLHGRLDPARLRRLLDAFLDPSSVDEWYLCGPHGMVTSAIDLLANLGVAPSQVHHEIFHVDPASESGSTASLAPLPDRAARVTVTLDGRTTVVDMPSRDESILTATLRVRPDAPYSCTGGVCGTCRARLVSGEVRMDHAYALDAADLAAGVVLACQSRPMSDEVVLSYDA